MPQRRPGILLVLALAAATAYAQTTTTTGTPTTSTTTPGSGCRLEHGARALCGIGPRLAAFRETVFETYTDLGRLFDPISFRLQKSAFCFTRAIMLCVGSEPTPPGKAPRIVPDVNRARAKLQKCVRPLDGVLAKLRSRYARRIIPPDVAAMLASETGGIASDLKAARESLMACP